MLRGDKGLAVAAGGGDDAAFAGSGSVDFGVAGTEETGALVDEEGHSFTEFNGAGEKGVEWAAGTEGYGVTFGALIKGSLDAGRVQLLLVGFGDAVGGRAQLGLEGGADGREFRLGDLAGVLRVQRG